jgi:hypothetical protein
MSTSSPAENISNTDDCAVGKARTVRRAEEDLPRSISFESCRGTIPIQAANQGPIDWPRIRNDRCDRGGPDNSDTRDGLKTAYSPRSRCCATICFSSDPITSAQPEAAPLVRSGWRRRRLEPRVSRRRRTAPVPDGPVTIGFLAQVINVLQKEVDAAALIQIRKSWINSQSNWLRVPAITNKAEADEADQHHCPTGGNTRFRGSASPIKTNHLRTGTQYRFYGDRRLD